MYLTYADTFRPEQTWRVVLYEVGLLVLGSVFLALTARVSFHIGPVPITGQTFGVLLLGALYGSRRGAGTVVAYLMQGTAGLPVFAGGSAGAAVLVGPTGGYLFGFVVAAFVVGRLAERGWDSQFWTTAAAMLLGTLIIYLFGLPWLGYLVGPDNMVALGLLPFLPGDLLKVALAAALLPAGWRLLGKARR